MKQQFGTQVQEPAATVYMRPELLPAVLLKV